MIQADGGTRTASITGGFVALVLALEQLREQDAICARSRSPTTSPPPASASSTATPLLDLAYDEDSRAEVDMNVVKTGDGASSRCRHGGEALPFGRDALDALLELADHRDPATRRQAARHRRTDPEATRLLVATTMGGAIRIN